MGKNGRKVICTLLVALRFSPGPHPVTIFSLITLRIRAGSTYGAATRLKKQFKEKKVNCCGSQLRLKRRALQDDGYRTGKDVEEFSRWAQSVRDEAEERIREINGGRGAEHR